MSKLSIRDDLELLSCLQVSGDWFEGVFLFLGVLSEIPAVVGRGDLGIEKWGLE